MKNIEKMKQALVDQIQSMTAEQYLELNDRLCEEYESEPDIINKNAIFTCDDCKNMYGGCIKNDETDECDNRFMMYADSIAE